MNIVNIINIMNIMYIMNILTIRNIINIMNNVYNINTMNVVNIMNIMNIMIIMNITGVGGWRSHSLGDFFAAQKSFGSFKKALQQTLCSLRTSHMLDIASNSMLKNSCTISGINGDL